MIRFPCKCGNRLEVPDDQAGMSVQCARCGVLVDIPGETERKQLEEDGTYKLDAEQLQEQDGHLKDLTKVYFPGRHTSDGEEIDLRGAVTKPDGPADPDFQDEELKLKDELQPEPLPVDKPRYDPETGELIKPIEIKEEEHPTKSAEAMAAAGPLPMANRIVDYSATATADDLVSRPVCLGLFAPINLVVMGVVFVGHVFLIANVLVGLALPLMMVPALVLAALLMGHYGMVLEEMGPHEREELPRPLRDVVIYDDMISPFLHMSGAMLLCYWPVGLVFTMNYWAIIHGNPAPFDGMDILGPALLVLGGVFFPAVFLATTTSGTVANLRPDRVLLTIARIGWWSVPLSLLWTLSVCSSLVGLWAGLVLFAGQASIFGRAYVALPLIMLGVILAHAFCWYLGRIYRRKHASFPWVGQHHVALPTAVAKPSLHAKVAAADAASRARAARRREVR